MLGEGKWEGALRKGRRLDACKFNRSELTGLAWRVNVLQKDDNSLE